jgi:hypothetical protein
MKKGPELIAVNSELPNRENRNISFLRRANRDADVRRAKSLNRLKNKIQKVKSYWDKETLTMPNVFKMNICSFENPKLVFEFNDLSLKGMMGVLPPINDSSENVPDECNEFDDLGSLIMETGENFMGHFKSHFTESDLLI